MDVLLDLMPGPFYGTSLEAFFRQEQTPGMITLSRLFIRNPFMVAPDAPIKTSSNLTAFTGGQNGAMAWPHMPHC